MNSHYRISKLEDNQWAVWAENNILLFVGSIEDCENYCESYNVDYDLLLPEPKLSWYPY
jgi:hypothetical protein